MKRSLDLTVKKLEKTILNLAWLEDLIGKYSLVGNAVFFTVEQFPWAKELEANWLTIRQELDSVLDRVTELPNYQDISQRQANITNDDRWKTYFFYAFGYKAEQNCQQCPETWKLLAKIPGLQTAFFSILAPQKYIPEHRGKHKGVIRYHLGLKVPDPPSACRIRVGNEIAYWEEGKSLLFDDTFLHEAWNDSNDYRVVLFLDIARPLPFPLSVLNWSVNKLIAASPIVQEAKENHENWRRQFEQTSMKTEQINKM